MQASIRRPSFLLAALALALAAAGIPAPALGAPRSPQSQTPPPADVESAERFYANLDYENANRTAQRALQQKGLTHDQLVRGWRIVAITDAILDNSDDARDSFVQLLTYSPEFQLDSNLSPKVQQPFLEARGFWRVQTVKPGLDLTVTARAGEVATLRLTTRDPTHIVEAVQVGFRWGASSAYTTKPAAIGDGVLIETSVPPQAAGRIDYYIQALDHRDNVVFEIGNPTSPKSTMLELPPPAPPPPPKVESKSILKSPVFWGVVVAAVAGGAVASFILLQPRDASTATLSAGLGCGDNPCR